MKPSEKKNKTDFLISGLTAKDLSLFGKFLSARTAKKNILACWELNKSKNRINTGVAGDSGLNPVPRKNGHQERKAMSDLNKLIETFYVFRGVDKDEQGRMFYLLKELRMRHLDKLFSEVLSDVKKYHKQRILKGFVHYVTLLRSYYEEYFISHAMNDEENIIKLSSQISDASQNILIQKVLFENVNRKIYANILREPRKKYIVSYENVVAYVEEHAGYFKSRQENIYVLYLTCKLIENSGDEDEVRKVLKFVRSAFMKFTPEFAYTCYENLLRYLIGRINRGVKASLNLAFELIKEIENKGLLDHISHIQPLDFFAIVNLYVRMGKNEMGERFIEKYSGRLISDSRDDLLKICTAIIEFSKGNFNISKTLLSGVKVKSLPLYLFSKSTLVKSLYEKNELMAISSISDTVKHFLNRKKELTPVYKESIFRFFSYINRLAYSRRNNGKGISKIESDLASELSFYQKSWIDVKFAELKSNFPDN